MDNRSKIIRRSNKKPKTKFKDWKLNVKEKLTRKEVYGGQNQRKKKNGVNGF